MNFCKVVFISILFVSGTITAQKQIVGMWKTIDDTTEEAKSIVEVYKKGNKLFGKIKKILNEEEKDNLCTECKGSNYNKSIEGMVIINGLKKNGKAYEDGTILDPENGKIYRCKIWIDENNPDILNLRGYITFLYRTQQWVRI